MRQRETDLSENPALSPRSENLCSPAAFVHKCITQTAVLPRRFCGNVPFVLTQMCAYVKLHIKIFSFSSDWYSTWIYCGDLYKVVCNLSGCKSESWTLTNVIQPIDCVPQLSICSVHSLLLIDCTEPLDVIHFGQPPSELVNKCVEFTSLTNLTYVGYLSQCLMSESRMLDFVKYFHFLWSMSLAVWPKQISIDIVADVCI